MTDEEQRAKNAAKSRKRREQLQEAAVRDGFKKASEAITAWKNGAFVLISIEVLERLQKLAE